jgi:hypothetical protein
VTMVDGSPEPPAPPSPASFVFSAAVYALLVVPSMIVSADWVPVWLARWTAAASARRTRPRPASNADDACAAAVPRVGFPVRSAYAPVVATVARPVADPAT